MQYQICDLCLYPIKLKDKPGQQGCPCILDFWLPNNKHVQGCGNGPGVPGTFGDIGLSLGEGAQLNSALLLLPAGTGTGPGTGTAQRGRGWGRADLAAPRPWERAKPPCLLAAPPLFGRPAPPPASAQRVGLRLHRVPEPGLCPCSPGQNSHPDLAARVLVLFVPSPVHKELVQPGAVNICWQSRAHREEDAIVQEPTVTF